MKKVISHLRPVNTYVSEFEPGVDLASDANKKDQIYISLDEQTVPSGIKVVHTIRNYEITPDYVNSFCEGADYRHNLAENINSPASRPNLCDTTLLQQVAAMDDVARISFLEELQKKVELEKTKKLVSEKNTNGDLN